MPKIVTTDQMRAIEQAADAQGHPYARMMEYAGRAVADCARNLIAARIPPDDPLHIVVLVGPGNNGGDGLVAARILQQELHGAEVRALLLTPRDPANDPVFAAALEAGVEIVPVPGGDATRRAACELVADAHLVLDALFGTRLRLPIDGEAAHMLQGAHQGIARHRAVPPSYITPTDPRAPDSSADRPLVVAVDCPSGLDCDSGALDPLALRAHATVTLAAAKPGLFCFPAANAVGTLHIGNIGLPAPLPALDEVTFTLADAAETGRRLPRRPRRSHKGTFGKTLVVGGSLNYTGAPYLAASAAYRVGAGLVTVAAPDKLIPTLAGMLPEATWLPLPHNQGSLNAASAYALRDDIAGYTAALIGPGLGLSGSATDFLRDLLAPVPFSEAGANTSSDVSVDTPADGGILDQTLPPLVLDAGALTLLTRLEDWPRRLPAYSILTPHPAEFARLAGLTTTDVQLDRLGLAQSTAAAWGCIVVLKGAFTIIAAPDGRAALLPFATSALATAGTGDVLAGTIAGLLGQGLDPFDAALAGGWLHAAAGERAARKLNTEASVIAGDVLALLPAAYALAEQHRPIQEG